MDASEQGTREVGKQRYLAVPRTLIFLLAGDAEAGDETVLLLRGAAHKRLWAGRYNGLGGHVGTRRRPGPTHAALVTIEKPWGLRADPLQFRLRLAKIELPSPPFPVSLC